MSGKLRLIVIDNKHYLHKVEHHKETEFGRTICTEKVTIYQEGFKKSPLRIIFKEGYRLKWRVGHPDKGVLWSVDDKALSSRKTVQINLNRPAVIAAFVRHFTGHGWSPEEQNSPYLVKEGLKLIEMIDLPKGIN